MRAFLAHSFDERHGQEELLTCIEDVLNTFGVEAFSFVKSYPPYGAGEEQKMMDDAFRELSKCDILIAEASTKAIGVGIEVGYAKSRSIPVIYLYSAESPASKTIMGCADFTIKYTDTESLTAQLSKILKTI